MERKKERKKERAKATDTDRLHARYLDTAPGAHASSVTLQEDLREAKRLCYKHA